MNDVSSRVDPRDHLEYEDLLPAAAFGTLSAEEHALLRAHLATCAECGRTLPELIALSSALPITLEDLEPPSNLRDRIAAMIEAQPVTSTTAERPRSTPAPSSVSTPTPIRRSVFRPVYLAAAAAILLIALAGGAVIGQVFFGNSADDTNSETIALSFANPDYAGASGDVKYLEDDGVFVVSTANMPAAPKDHVYQVWLINAAGAKPVGVMNNPDGTFSVAADRDAYQTLAITVEPGPLGSTGPTTDPFVSASLGSSSD